VPAAPTAYRGQHLRPGKAGSAVFAKEPGLRRALHIHRKVL